MPQYDPKKIVHNIEDMIEEGGGGEDALATREERGVHRETPPRELRQSIGKLLDKNALNRMREIKNVDKMVSSGGGPLRGVINRVYRLFTRPQAEYNDLNLEALTIVSSQLETLRLQLTRLEEQRSGITVTGESAADFRRLTALVSDHLREVYSNASSIHRDIESVVGTMNDMLVHLRRIGEEMNGITTNQKDLNGQISATRQDTGTLWAELDRAYEIFDGRANDLWQGLEERDRQIAKNAEAAHAVSEVSREIKARLLVISEQITQHQEMLQGLQSQLTVSTPRRMLVENETPDVKEAVVPPSLAPPVPKAASDLTKQLMGLAYTRFQRQFRADDAELLQRQNPYVELLKKHHGEAPLNAHTPRVLDIACGDGIFLEAIKGIGWDCLGVDLNRTMVNHGKSLGRPIELAEAFEFLRNAEEKSFTAVTAFQFIEHLTAEQLMEFIAGAYRVLKPGGVILTETINPHTLASFRWFHMDLTHAHLVFPEVLQIMEETAGFQLIEWQELNPVEGNVALSAEGNTPEARNARKLNKLLYGNQDYYLISRWPA